MNRTFGQFASPDSLRLQDGATAPPVPVPHAFHDASAEQALFRFDLRRSLEMHRRLALGCALFGLVLSTLYLVKYWSLYSAQSLIYIDPTPTEVPQGAAPMHWTYNYDPAIYDSNVEQQIASMTRRDVLVAAVHKLGSGVWRQSGESDEGAADRLKGAIKVARVASSYQVSITARASKPDTAAALANAVAASYIEDISQQQKAGDAERLAMLRDESERVKKELDDDRVEQAALNAQLGVAAIGPVAPEHYDDDIGKIHDELVKARTDHDEAAARLTAMDAKNGLSSAALDAEADQLISNDPGLASLKTALLQRRAALVSQMANLTPSHPQYKQDEAELAKIDASLDSATKNLRAKAAARIEEQLHTDLDRTAGMEARLNGELAQMTKAAAGATPKLQRASDLASDIARLQNRYSAVDEQLQNQILEDNAPGTAHLAVAAVVPQHRAIASVIRNALALFLVFVFFGLAAAVIAQKLDPRIYIASDVEQLLGFAPMAQLPDFEEVPSGVADEHLLRLAAGIEYACKEGGLRSCIVTGTGPGTGATTVATRVREMLATMGRPTLLLNTSGSAAAAPLGGLGTEQSLAQPAARSTALLQQVDEETENGDESLVLTDTAPLAISAETEYLARFADCTIVVAESGLTTRAQLRAAASRLHRLNVAVVGVVLNRVGLEKADPAYRRSIAAMEKHLNSQIRSTARQTFSSPVVSEPIRASAELPAAAASAAASGQASKTVALAAGPAFVPERRRVAAAAAPSPPVAAALPPARHEPQPEAAPSADIPWWLTEAPAYTTAMTQPGKPPQPHTRIGRWESELDGAASREASSAADAGSVSEETAHANPSRLSGLRGLFFSLGVKEMNEADQAKPEAGAAPATPEPQPERTVPVQSQPIQAAEVPAPAEPTVPAPTIVPYPEPVPATTAANGNGSRRDPMQLVTAAPEFLPPKPLKPERRDRSEAFDEVQTLPSWRGQYKRKS